jgi:hypothetical protein
MGGKNLGKKPAGDTSWFWPNAGQTPVGDTSWFRPNAAKKPGRRPAVVSAAPGRGRTAPAQGARAVSDPGGLVSGAPTSAEA